MKRREFITLIRGAAVAWPIATLGQQPDRLRRVGVFINPVADDPVTQARLAAFVEGLQQLGWTDGRNVPRGFERQAYARRDVVLQGSGQTFEEIAAARSKTGPAP